MPFKVFQSYLVPSAEKMRKIINIYVVAAYYLIYSCEYQKARSAANILVQLQRIMFFLKKPYCSANIYKQ
jgi:hypothetical protein